MAVTSFILALVHYVLALRTLVYRWLVALRKPQIVSYRKQTVSGLKSDSQTITKLPIHLGVVIVEKDISYADIANIILWTVAMGISYISIYDRQGVVKRNQSLLQSALDKQRTRLLGEEKHKFNVHIGHSKARPIQNGSTCAAGGSVMLLSIEDGRQDVVQTARQLSRAVAAGQYRCSDITPSNVDSIMLEKSGFPDPDLLLKFGPVDCLMGFLPWQIRLTEMLDSPSHQNIGYTTFYQLLDRYSTTEQRLGK